MCATDVRDTRQYSLNFCKCLSNLTSNCKVSIRCVVKETLCSDQL